MKKQLFILPLLIIGFCSCQAQPLNGKQSFTKQDTLRGTIGPEREWWDVLHYDITVRPDFASKSITGKTTIKYKVLPGQRTDYMQIDLQDPLVIDTIFYDGKLYINYPARPYYKEGNVWHIPLPKVKTGSVHTISIAYHGTPREAQLPPWDGGWIFTTDEKKRPWMTVACQGLGASVWFPCKDHQSDEPEEGASLTVIVPDPLVAVANGRLTSKTPVFIGKEDGDYTAYTWTVQNPINSYNIVPYIGAYVNLRDTLMGEKGKLDLSCWILDYETDNAKQVEQVKPTLRAFEYWFGPYPFYEDGYQLVQAPHLGMEHQSAIAYGNEFKNGYLGKDLSGTGWGLKWDYIIVHETGHEWFANSITTRDIADMWVHEGFTDYSETLFVEYYYGKQAANEYVQGLRKNILNDVPIIGPYGVNKEGSGDMYFKGANIVHTIRQLINDDEKFRELLRGMNRDFYHQIVTSKQIEDYIIKKTGLDLRKFFDQYLRTTKVPVLEVKGNQYRWTNCVEGFKMPVRLKNGEWIYPESKPKKLTAAQLSGGFEVDPNFYIEVKKS